MATIETAVITPLNGSAVHGTASLVEQGGSFTLDIQLAGIAPFTPVPMQVQGFCGMAVSTLPTGPAADTNHDGLIDLREAAATLGPPILELSQGQAEWMADPSQDTPALPVAGPDGTVHYHETFAAPPTGPDGGAITAAQFAASLETGAIVVYRGGPESLPVPQAAGVFEPPASDAATHPLTLLG